MHLVHHAPLNHTLRGKIIPYLRFRVWGFGFWWKHQTLNSKQFNRWLPRLAQSLQTLAYAATLEPNVNGTGTLHGGAATILNPGGSSTPGQNITVAATTGALTINGTNDAGEIGVAIGTGNMQTIRGAVIDNNDDFTGTDLFINDSTDTTGRNATITGYQPLVISGFSPAPIDFNQAADAFLSVNVLVPLLARYDQT